MRLVPKRVLVIDLIIFFDVKEKQMKGKVKWFNRQRGFGFITGEDGKEYFVHYLNLKMDGYKYLEEDQSVTFDTEPTDKGVQAINVEVVSGT